METGTHQDEVSSPAAGGREEAVVAGGVARDGSTEESDAAPRPGPGEDGARVESNRHERLREETMPFGLGLDSVSVMVMDRVGFRPRFYFFFWNKFILTPLTSD